MDIEGENINSKYLRLNLGLVHSILSESIREGYTDIETLIPYLLDAIRFLDRIQHLGYPTIESVLSYLSRITNRIEKTNRETV